MAYERVDGKGFPAGIIVADPIDGKLYDSNRKEVVWVGPLPVPNAPGQGSNPFPGTKVGEGVTAPSVSPAVAVDLQPVLDMLGLAISDMAKIKARFGIS